MSKRLELSWQARRPRDSIKVVGSKAGGSRQQAAGIEHQPARPKKCSSMRDTTSQFWVTASIFRDALGAAL